MTVHISTSHLLHAYVQSEFLNLCLNLRLDRSCAHSIHADRHAAFLHAFKTRDIFIQLNTSTHTHTHTHTHTQSSRTPVPEAKKQPARQSQTIPPQHAGPDHHAARPSHSQIHQGFNGQAPPTNYPNSAETRLLGSRTLARANEKVSGLFGRLTTGLASTATAILPPRPSAEDLNSAAAEGEYVHVRANSAEKRNSHGSGVAEHLSNGYAGDGNMRPLSGSMASPAVSMSGPPVSPALLLT